MSRNRAESIAWTAAGLVFLSGAAALVLETVWLRMLARAFGVTIHAVSTVTAVYMGGLALGAWGASRYLKGRNGLKAYALLEAAGALAALACTGAMLRLPAALASLAGDGPLDPLLRLLLCAPVLLPPTVLWGATLPALARFLAAGGGAPETAGRLYGANTLGAALGAAAAGFWLIGEWGESAAVSIAVSLGLAASAGAWALRSTLRGPGQAVGDQVMGDTTKVGVIGDTTKVVSPGDVVPPANAVLWLYALSGFCALGYEILWSRQLTLLLGNSVYAFSLELAIILTGIGLGSFAWTRLKKTDDNLAAFGGLQLGLGAAAVWSLLAYRWLGLAADSPDYLYSPLHGPGDVSRMALQAAVMILPASVVMGLSFPAAAAALAPEEKRPEALVGRLYAFNTLGAILGSIAAGFFGIGWLGAQASFLAFAAVNLGAGAAALGLARRRARRPTARPALLAGLTIVSAIFLREDPTMPILAKRLRRELGEFEFLFHKESAAATVTGIAAGPRRTLLINGIKTAGKGFEGALMAAIPNAMLESPASTLVICFGAGSTYRTASRLGGEVRAVELVGDVVGAMPYFWPDAARHLTGPGRAQYIEDGRHHLLRSGRRHDIIIVDTSPPLYSSGAVNLYTREFMDLARARLTSEGIFTLWLPLEAYEADYWSILRSMSDAFPYVSVWNAPEFSGILCLGSTKPLLLDEAILEKRIRSRTTLKLVPWINGKVLRNGFVLGPEDVRRLTAGHEPVTDDRPRTEFPLRRMIRGERVERDAGFLFRARDRR